MRREWKTEGILLERIPYQERHFITTFLTLDQGIHRFFIAKKKGEPLDPLTCLEVICQSSKSGSWRVVDSYRIETFQALRSSFQTLMLAGKLAKALLMTQMEGKPSETLYILFKRYLIRMGMSLNPGALGTSFLLKLMRYEGGLFLSEKELIGANGPLSFPELSLEEIQLLLFSRHFEEIEKVAVQPEAFKAIFNWLDCELGRGVNFF